MVYTIIAGVNGCGKSSFTGSLSEVDKKMGIIIDTDSITAKNGGDKLSGGKAAAKMIDDCLKHGYDFTQETTLSGVKTLHTIKKARKLGYDIRMYYIAVSSAEECVKRIKNRVSKGGHDIPEETVKRRFENRFNDLLRVLRYCETTVFYDNENGFVRVGEYVNGKLFAIAENRPKWVDELANQMEKLW